MDQIKKILIVVTGLCFLTFNVNVHATGKHFKRFNPFKHLKQKIVKLERRVEALEQNSSAPVEITVDCTAGDSVNAALNAAPASATSVTITLQGICTENVVIDRNNVSLTGGSIADGIQALDPTLGTVLVIRGVSNVTLDSLSITGGAFGLACRESSSVVARDIHISGAEVGVSSVGGSSCITIDAVLESNRIGIISAVGGFIRFVGGVIDNTGIPFPPPPPDFGAIAAVGGSIDFASEAPSLNVSTTAPVIRGNLFGLFANGGVILLTTAVVENNITGANVAAGGLLASAVTAVPGDIAIQNNNQGISVANFSRLRLTGSTGINNNAGFGINCAATPGAVFDLNITAVTFSGNGAGDISPNCP